MTLPIRQVSIQERLWRTLNRDVWRDRYFQGSMKLNGLSRPIQIRVRGGHTREYPKKSYELVANGITVHMNAEYDDPSMIRNALSFTFFRMIGVPSPETKFSTLLVNGEDLGIYVEIEAVDRQFFRKRKIGMKSLVYATNDDATFSLISPETKQRKESLFDGYKLMIGTTSERKRLASFIAALNALEGQALYDHINSNLDIDNYLRWLAGAVCTGNYDGFNQNYALYRHESTNKYRIIPWDYEGTWSRDSYGKFFGREPVPITGRNELTKRLLSFRPVRRQYAELLQGILASTFTVARIAPIVERLYEEISPTIAKDRTRKYSYATFYEEQSFILNYVKERREVLSQEMKQL